MNVGWYRAAMYPLSTQHITLRSAYSDTVAMMPYNRWSQSATEGAEATGKARSSTLDKISNI